MSSLTIKSHYNGVIKRVTTKPAPRSFAEFENLLSMQHGLAHPFKLTYVDDEGDKIALTTDMDLQEAIRIAKAQKNLLKVHVQIPRHKKKAQKPQKQPKPQRRAPQKRAPPSPSSIPSFADFPQSFFHEMLANPQQMLTILPFVIEQIRGSIPMLVSFVEGSAELKEALGTLLDSDCVRVEQSYICDYCETHISGTRFHCTGCADFDLCSTCHTAKGSQHPHKFQQVSALDAILTYLKNGGDPMVFAQAYFAKGRADDDVSKAQATHNAICDGCDEKVVGARHRCLQCPDFDLCTACVDAGFVHPHAFFKIATPKPADRRAYEVAKDQFVAEKLAQEALAKQERLRAQKEAEQRAQAEAEAERLSLEEQRMIREAEEVEREAALKAQAQAEKEKEAPAPKPLNAFERNLVTLEQMGFTDRAMCIRELVKNRNELLPTIQALLA